MIAVVAAILGMTVIGIPIAVAAGRDVRGGALIGLAFLYGSGAVFVAMMLLPWNLPLVVVALVAVSALVFFMKRPRGTDRSAGEDTGAPQRAMSIAADLATALTLFGYAMFATLASPWEWDFNAIWGLKARVFYEHGGIDWRFLQSPWNDFAHPDYPLLVPMNFDFLALASGAWNDRWLGLMFVGYAVALVLIIRELMREELAAPLPALITLAIAGLACTRYVGLAEGALVAFATAAMLMLRRGEVTHAALLFGLAASTKQEGALFLVCALIALVIARRWRDAIRLWPAFLIAVPWWIVAAARGLKSDLAVPGAMHRAAVHLAQWSYFVSTLGEQTPDLIFWLLVLASIVIALRRDEVPWVLIVVLQIAALLMAYLTTPYGLHWHIATSWPRLTRQLAPIAAVLALVLLAKTFAREKNHAHVEARSEL